MTTTPVTRAVRAVVALLVTLLVASCTSLPRSGPVHSADPQIPPGYGVDVLAEGPAVDASPEEIVNGFLRASAYGHGDQFQVASQYLAPGVVWEPLTQVRVYSAGQSPDISVSGADGGISVTVEQVASVDEVGRYEVMSATSLRSTFSLVRTEENQWRIADLDPGLLVSDVNFEQTFAVASLHFLTRDVTATVPELRWYPLEDRASHIVGGLLAGPSGWMERGVTSAFPEGTTLLRSVVVQDGVATINLSDSFNNADDHAVALANAQLENSLSTLSEIGSIDLLVGGSEVEVPDFAVDLTLPSTAPGPVVVTQGTLARYSSSTGLQQIPGTPDLSGRDPRHPAVPFEGVDAPRVVVADGGTSILTVPDDGSEPTVLLTGENLSPPSIDRYGYIWTAQENVSDEIVAVRSDGSTYRIDATWLEGRRVSDVRIAVDGARAVVVSHTDDRTFVELVGVGRDLLGRPRSMGEPLRIAEFLNDVLDISWAGPTSLVILGNTISEDTVRVHRISIGGLNEVLPNVSDAVAVASSRNERSVVVANSSGGLFMRSGSAWQMVVTGITDPVYSG